MTTFIFTSLVSRSIFNFKILLKYCIPSEKYEGGDRVVVRWYQRAGTWYSILQKWWNLDPKNWGTGTKPI